MIASLGDLVEDIIVWLPGAPRLGTDTPARIFRRRGGSAANVAAFVASTGTPVRFVGRIGADSAGVSISEELSAAGVDVRVQRNGRTGTVVVLVGPNGERTMLPDRGAATELAGAPAGWMSGVELLHVPAYSLTVEPLAWSALAAIRQVRAIGGRISVDASSVQILDEYGVERFRQLLRELTPDVLFANADEARLLRVAADGPPGRAFTVVKDGPNPVMFYDPDSRSPRSIAVPPVARVRDTTGAGDAFAAGYLAALWRGASNPSCVAAGNELAAKVIATPGAALPASDRGGERGPSFG